MANYPAQSAIQTVPTGTGNPVGSFDGQKYTLFTFLQWVTEAEGSIPETKWRTEATEDYDFYAGRQDTAVTLAKLDQQKRPDSVFNTIMPKVNMLCGLAAQSNKAPYVFPVGTEDDALAELMNGAFKHYRYKTKMGDRENECFEHMVKSGRSFLHFYVDKTNPFKPMIKAVRIPGRDVLLDPLSQDYLLDDARYIIVDKWLSVEEIKVRWPEFDPQAVKQFSTNQVNVPEYYSSVRDRYRLSECWYRMPTKVLWFINPLTGEPDSCSPEEFRMFTRVLAQGINIGGRMFRWTQPIETHVGWENKVYYAIFSNYTLLEAGASPYKHNHFPYVLYGAYKDENENRWFSVITMMKDPQRGKNTMRRQLVHLLNTAPKGILMHEIGALLDPDKYDQESSSPNYRMEIKKGMMEKVKFSDQPQISPIYQALDNVFEEDQKDVSGIRDDLMGIQTSSREPGITVRMRQQAGMAVLYMLFDHFRRSRLRGGEILLSMIQQYITYRDIIRMEGPKGNMLVQINSQMNPAVAGFNDINSGEYDLRIDEAVDTSTMRMVVAQMLTDFSQNNPGVVPPDVIMEYSDLPLTVRNRVMEYHMMQQEREERMMAAELQTKREAAATKGLSDVIKTRAAARERVKAQRSRTAAKPNSKEA